MSEIKGILVNRDQPITAGWCGNDNCDHRRNGLVCKYRPFCGEIVYREPEVK